mmetsp:Transcript_10168/g.24988  ORF Transcript_10168/g.24988 Transcript_10168/m.24988 type:complete len:349 (+) Transcript_10168:619-1665(+)
MRLTGGRAQVFHSRVALTLPAVEVTVIRQAPAVFEPSAVVARVDCVFAHSDHAAALLEELDAHFPGLHQVAAAVQHEGLEIWRGYVQCHVVLRRLPVEPPFPGLVGGRIHVLRHFFWGHCELKRLKHQLGKHLRPRGDRVGVQLRDVLGVHQRKSAVPEQVVKVQLQPLLVGCNPVHAGLKDALFRRVEFVTGDHGREDVVVQPQEAGRLAHFGEVHQEHVQALPQRVVVVRAKLLGGTEEGAAGLHRDRFVHDVLDRIDEIVHLVRVHEAVKRPHRVDGQHDLASVQKLQEQPEDVFEAFEREFPVLHRADACAPNPLAEEDAVEHRRPAGQVCFLSVVELAAVIVV